jgi:hypothetical protein
MIRRAWLAAVLVAVFSSSAFAATADDLELWFDADRTAYLHNTTASQITFDGYQIISESNRLDVAGWDSISDRVPGRINELIGDLGAGALGFGELAPTSSQVAEANLTGVGVLQPGAKFSLGKPFSPSLPLNEICSDITFFFKIGGIPIQFEGQPGICLPEPSSWLLAMLAGPGLVAIWRRKKKTVAGSPTSRYQ